MTEEKELVKTSRFMLMEAADNAQIVAEINGEMLKAMVYRFKGKDRLSYAGAKFAAIQLGNIHVKESSVTYNKDLDQFEASALAYNENINLTLPGYAEQPRLMKVWDNPERTESHLETDEFARRKAASKAVRNALMAVMPSAHIAAYMKAAIEGGKTRAIKNVDSMQSKPEKKKPEKKMDKKAPNKIQLSLGEVNVDVIVYNLRAIGVIDVVDVSEQDDGFYVEPFNGMNDEDYNLVNETLDEMGAEWIDDKKLWIIRKEASD